ncbi:MAG: amidohydrolase [Oscillospiraceae bacterium]|jgi:5-methylthioadenosine/S-adenosylhomocysteine deaminase|nr:amidohydrolase [Oscillospiraceae bacterium]
MIFHNTAYITPEFTVERADITIAGGVISSIAPPTGDPTRTLMIPGLVNSHSHVPMTLLRGWGEGLPLDRWLTERVFPFEALMTDSDVCCGALVGIAEMLASGVTDFRDMYDHCDAIADAVTAAGIKCRLSRGLTALDGSAFAGSQGERETLALFERAAASDLITPEIAIHAEYTSHPDFVRDAASLAKSLNAAVHVHVSETYKEHTECITRNGVTPTAYFAKLGLFDTSAVAAHCVWVTDDDIRILRDYGVTVSHNPSSNMKLGSGFAPVRKMLDAGVSVALGTDGAASNNNLNMFEEMHLAALMNGLTPAEALRMAARGNSITVGGAADVAVIDLDKPHLRPNHDVLASLVYSAQSSDVATTLVNGEVVYERGVGTRFNLAEALDLADESAARIASALSDSRKQKS